MNNIPYKEWRLRRGWLTVTEEFYIDSGPVGLSDIFAKIGFLPVEVKFDCLRLHWRYGGFCSQFKELKEGESAPEYNLLFDSDGNCSIARDLRE